MPKLSKHQMLALFDAHKHQDFLWDILVCPSVRMALMRKGLIYDRTAFPSGVPGYYLTPAGVEVASRIVKDDNIVPLRRPA